MLRATKKKQEYDKNNVMRRTMARSFLLLLDVSVSSSFSLKIVISARASSTTKNTKVRELGTRQSARYRCGNADPKCDTNNVTFVHTNRWKRDTKGEGRITAGWKHHNYDF